MDRTTVAFLAHYGVKGMKWGVRKDRRGGVTTTGRRRRGSTAEPQSEDSKKAQKLKSKSARSLSNAELKALNERLNLEQNYSRMTQEKNKIDQGHDYVKTALGIGKTASEIYNLAQSPLGKAVRGIISEQLKNR